MKNTINLNPILSLADAKFLLNNFRMQLRHIRLHLENGKNNIHIGVNVTIINNYGAEITLELINKNGIKVLNIFNKNQNTQCFILSQKTVKEVEVKYIDITNFDEDPNAHYLHKLFNDIVNNNKDQNIVYFFDGKEYTKKFLFHEGEILYKETDEPIKIITPDYNMFPVLRKKQDDSMVVRFKWYKPNESIGNGGFITVYEMPYSTKMLSSNETETETKQKPNVIKFALNDPQAIEHMQNHFAIASQDLETYNAKDNIVFDDRSTATTERKFDITLDEFYKVNLCNMNKKEREAQIFLLIENLLISLDNFHQGPTFKAHRDLKPENIFLKNDLSVVPSDLGFSVTDGNQSSIERPGTPTYAAPELFRPGCSSTPQQQDVFSMGRILAYLAGACDPEDYFPQNISVNMSNNYLRDNQDKIEKFGGINLYPLLSQMCHADADQRPTAEQALQRYRELKSQPRQAHGNNPQTLYGTSRDVKNPKRDIPYAPQRNDCCVIL